MSLRQSHSLSPLRSACCPRTWDLHLRLELRPIPPPQGAGQARHRGAVPPGNIFQAQPDHIAGGGHRPCRRKTAYIRLRLVRLRAPLLLSGPIEHTQIGIRICHVIAVALSKPYILAIPYLTAKNFFTQLQNHPLRKSDHHDPTMQH